FSLHEAAFLKALKPYGLPFNYKDYIGQSTAEVFERFFRAAGKKIDQEELAELVSSKRQAANELYPTHLRFMEGAEPFVHRAYELGYQLFVGSSGSRRNILAGIEGLGL